MEPLHDFAGKKAIDPNLLAENFKRLQNDRRNARIRVTTPVAPNTEFAVQHGLDHVPTAVFLSRSNVPVRVYESGTAWTNSTVYLKADAASADVTLDIEGGDEVIA